MAVQDNGWLLLLLLLRNGVLLLREEDVLTSHSMVTHMFIWGPLVQIKYLPVNSD